MNHDEAVARGAVERYLLGELTAAERSEFEEHFFLCPECAEAVRTGAAFVANARAVFREQAGRRRWGLLGRMAHKPAFPYSAALLLALLLEYKELVRVPLSGAM